MLNTGKLAGKVLYITGASRGIGKTIALKAAKDGAKVVVAAKTAEPHPKLPGTIFTAAKEIEAVGGQALPCVVDVRDEASVQNSIEEAVKKFGGIDIVINNASAISLTGTEATPMKKYDLMNQINARGTYLVSKLALPYLRASKNNPHILNISPPLNMSPRWFKDHVAYTMAKYGMSMCVLGMAEEFKKDRIAVNALWPQTAIITAAMEMLGGEGINAQCRKPEIMADAAYVILTRDASNFTGNFAIDENILKEEGCNDLDQYAAVPGTKDFLPDFFLDDFDAYNEKAQQIKTGSAQTGSAQTGSSSGQTGSVQAVFDKIEKVLSAELVGKTKAVYQFNVKGSDEGSWYVDLKNGSGKVAKGQAEAADVTFGITDSDFQKMFKGQLKPTAAFMSGKLKLSGDMGKAMKLDKLMGQMRGYSTQAGSGAIFGQSKRFYSTEGPVYKSVDEVFSRIKEVASSDVVSQVKATYLFDVDEQGKYYVDLKNGDGSVSEGDPPTTPDVTITISKENIVRLFNRELKPATAFMTGALKLSGDLSKAMALENVMVAARQKGFHTLAGQMQRRHYSTPPPALYSSVPEVFERIRGVASNEIVEQVGAIYLFDVESEGKWFIDFKHGSGTVGEGEPANKADVTITMNLTNFLKIFNRELSPATAFMTGQIKVAGDLSKALTLEKVMKAAREAADKGA